MPLPDSLTIASLLAFGVLLCLPGSRRRRPTLWVLALTALATGGVAAWSLRWEVAPALAVALLLNFALLANRLRHAGDPSTRRPLAGVVVVTAAVAAALPYYFFPVFALPDPDGPHKVGMRHFQVVDHRRKGVLYAPADRPRTLPVTVWYPARAGEAAWTRPYLTRRRTLDELVSTARNFGLWGFRLTQLHSVRAHSRPGAPVAAKGGPFPVALFNHGFWSYRAQNTALMERLASHGFVVFSVAHPRDGAAVRLEDGTLVRSVPQTGPQGVGDPKAGRTFKEAAEAFTGGAGHAERLAALDTFKAALAEHRLGESARAWRADVLAVIRALEEDPPRTVADVIARAALDRRAHLGMSFGGTTAASACQADRHCAAVVNLDGENYHPGLFDEELRAPMLLLLSDRKQEAPDFDPTDYAWEEWSTMGEREDIHRWRVDGLDHLGLMDLTLSARPPFHAGLFGSLDGGRALRLQNDAVIAFLRAVVRGADTGFPGRVLDRYPEIEIHDPSGVQEYVRAREEE
ncbi:hypothetical protein [Thiohalorhabdus methylotrophus]|uniref:Dienelactone hydrolase n=1 Tax=Thiohalorhabdus methylotrophus TaxID=3242694 RepID=A0ABV4TYM2_9GAMM